MVDPVVLRRFSAGAARYEAHAHTQRLSARDLLAYTREWLAPFLRTDDGIVEPAPDRERAFRILEPGCGTGLYTCMLLDAFRGASVFGVDISEAMVRVAKRRIDDPRARFAVADAEEIATGRYDLVTSNATFQWFLSLPRTLARMASLLSGGGVLTFSFFGPETYAELDDAMRAAAVRRGAEGRVAAADGPGRSSVGAGRDAPGFVAATGFHSREEIAESMAAAFPRWEIDERRYRQEFPTVADLLRSIRYTGTGGGGAGYSWSPGRLARVEEAYRGRHGRIRATYQVFLCRGVIPEGGGR